MTKIIALLCSILLLSACAGPVKEVDLSNGRRDQAALGTECNSECVAAIAKSFTYGKRFMDSGIGAAILVEVNGVPGTNTFRCADCRGAVVNAFNDSWSGAYKVSIPAGETTLGVHASDFRVASKIVYKVSFNAMAGRTYALVQIQKDPLANEDAWMPVIVDTSSNQVVYPRDSGRWLRR